MMIKETTKSELDSTDSCLVRLLQNCGKGCKISSVVNAASTIDQAIWCRLLTLEVLETATARRERDSTTYFLSDIEEQPE
jgi:hypothetical protein